jgi:hypothetical protein
MPQAQPRCGGEKKPSTVGRRRCVLPRRPRGRPQSARQYECALSPPRYWGAQPYDVVVYPDSGMVLVCSTNELYRKSATIKYWDGEDTGFARGEARG